MVAESLCGWFSLTLHFNGMFHSGYFQFCVITSNSLAFVFNNLFVSPPISKPYFCILWWSFDLRFTVLQKHNFGFFPSYTGDVGKGIGPAVSVEAWSSSKWKNIPVIQDTPVMGFVFCHKYFFIWIWRKKKSYLTKEERWVKFWQERVWKNKLSSTMQLQRFHFSICLFSSQARKLLKYIDPVEKRFSIRVGVELMKGKEPVQ